MKKQKMSSRKKERRRFQRFSMNSNAYATFRHSEKVMGVIVDVSLDGIAIEYMNKDKRINDWNTLDIVSSRIDRIIKSIPAATIYDDTVSPKKTYAEGAARRCGFKFYELSSEQRKLLQQFIDEVNRMEPAESCLTTMTACI